MFSNEHLTCRQITRGKHETGTAVSRQKGNFLKTLLYATQWPIQGGPGGPAPPSGKVKKPKRAPLTENVVSRSRKRKFLRYYPRPPLNRIGFWRPRKISATTPPPPPLNRIGFWRSRKNSATTPPPLNRVDMALHTKAGPLLRKILDLRLQHIIFATIGSER